MIFGGTFTSDQPIFNLDSTHPNVTLYGGKFISTSETVGSGFVFKFPAPDFKIYQTELMGTKTDFYITNKSTGYPSVSSRFPTPAKVTVDGKEYSRSDLQSHHSIHGKKITVTCNFATDMSVEVTAPKHGKKPETPKVAWSRGLDASNFVWADYTTGDHLSATDTFVGGRKYTLGFNIRPKDGYHIAEEPVVNVWGQSVRVSVAQVDGQVYAAIIHFECPALITIDKVSLLTT